jgi:hypothetical protein
MVEQYADGGHVRRQECLLERFGCPTVSASEPFEDLLALVSVAEQRGLEDVKTAAWREPNRDVIECGGTEVLFAAARPAGTDP